jgi:hypothetical protein
MPRHKRVFLVEWNEDLGPEWMNKDNLEICLFTAESTRRQLLGVTEITEEITKLVMHANDMTDAVIDFAGTMIK